MEKERLDWILSGLNGGKGLNRDEKELLRGICEKFEQGESVSQYQEGRLEEIYRAKSR